MSTEMKNPCPTCQGKKIVQGVCECSMEWRGTERDDEWVDCQCTPEQPCATCNGSGVVPSAS